MLLLLLTGCSALMVSELGYSAHLTEPLHGASGAVHGGFGVGAGAGEEEPAAGLGTSLRIRSYGRALTAIEPGLHAYVMADRGPASLYLRGTAYVGMSFLPEGPGVVFSPTLQPGVLYCPEKHRVGWCGTLSAPLSYDLAPATDHPGLVAGGMLGIGWGNVITNPLR